MIRSFFIVCFVIYAAESNPLERSGREVCELGEYFVPANGYGWAKRDDGTICTCPDSVYTIDRPCRICDREGICGSNALCSEELQISDSKFHFGCFCPSGTFQLGEKCSDENITTVPVTTEMATSTTAAPGTTTSATQTTTTTTPGPITTTTTTSATTTTGVPEATTTTTTVGTTTKEITTTAKECVPPPSSGSRPWMPTTLVIALNLAYFFAK